MKKNCVRAAVALVVGLPSFARKPSIYFRRGVLLLCSHLVIIKSERWHASSHVSRKSPLVDMSTCGTRTTMVPWVVGAARMPGRCHRTSQHLQNEATVLRTPLSFQRPRRCQKWIQARNHQKEKQQFCGAKTHRYKNWTLSTLFVEFKWRLFDGVGYGTKVAKGMQLFI